MVLCLRCRAFDELLVLGDQAPYLRCAFPTRLQSKRFWRASVWACPSSRPNHSVSAFVATSPAWTTNRRLPGVAAEDTEIGPECPFCYIAAQSVGHIATATDAPAPLAHPGLFVSIISSQIVAGIVLPEFRRTGGEARAPPQFSI